MIGKKGLDSRVSASKTQVLASVDDDKMIVVETASFTGMPYADHVKLCR